MTYKTTKGGGEEGSRKRKVAVLDSREQLWMKRYNELKAYSETNGDALVPCEYIGNPSLGLWVGNQRRQYRLHKSGKDTPMNEGRIKMLEALKFQWSPYNTEWHGRFKELVQYYEKYGDTIVPQNFNQNLPLARWVVHQRHQYKLLKENKKGSQMTQQRIETLQTINFKWAPFDSDWMSRYKELAAYHKKHGHCLVDGEPHNIILAFWVQTQRRQYVLFERNEETTHMTAERLGLLSNLHFEWTVPEAKWKSRFVELARYVRRHGIGQIPRNEPSNRDLMRWLREQQKLNQQERLSKEKREPLLLLGVLTIKAYN